MPMRVLDAKAAGAKVTLAAKTIVEKRWREAQTPPFPEPVPITANRRGWVESEIDAWIEHRALQRKVKRSEPSAGRSRFWEDVKAGRRPHPRTAGLLKPEAEKRVTLLQLPAKKEDDDATAF